MIPVIIIVKILSELGAIDLISRLLSPLMGLMGLPGEAALIWAAAIFTNLYSAIAALLAIYPDPVLSVQQMTVLTTLMLVCHALPIELALCEKVGGSFRLMAPLRFFGALLLGILLHLIYSSFNQTSDIAVVNWVAQRSDENLIDWTYNQVINLLFVPCVLTGLLILVRLFDLLGINRLLAIILSPILRLIGISQTAATIAIFGLLAGITFGSGLLLAEARKKAVAPRDIILVLALLSLSHGLIEDTTLMLLMGADIYGILLGRVLFSIAVIAVIARLPDQIILRYRS